ncbi:very short patch repair endonuclease [Flavobacterium sp.]|uniref:very short patch repair endonuclease n=1 Tax=Flavobacterium sp. TaxID=239 RepID=UPI0039E25EAB
MNTPTLNQRSKNMQAIKSTGTKTEVMLAKSLYHKGYRYRKNDKTVFGKPDLTFKKLKLALFIDSEFFHGKDLETKKKPVNNAEFWEKKIKRNIERDQQVNEYLTSHGWTVLRFWSEDIKKNLHTVVRTIEETIEEKKNLIHYKTQPIKLPSGNYLQHEDLPKAAEPPQDYNE